MSPILLDYRDAVAVLSLNRPDTLNAVDPGMIEALSAACCSLADNPSVRAVVLRGNGDHFMAGGDLNWFRLQVAEPEAVCRERFEALIRNVQATVASIRTMDKPVVAAVHGAVAGFGLSLMMACDLALASEEAYFTLAYSKIGLSPDGGATWSLPRQVGLKQAMEIALLGDRFDAPHAQKLGLVNRVISRAGLDAEALSLAMKLAAGPAMALARTKALLNQSGSNTLEQQLIAEQSLFTKCTVETDFSEGLNAFFERRKPVYRRP